MINQATANNTSRPWYREPWPWILMTGPFVVVIAGSVTAWLAASGQDPVIDENYYQNGLALARRGAEEGFTRLAGPRAEIAVGADRRIRLFLSGDHSEQVVLRFEPTDGSSPEQQLKLRAESPGFFSATLSSVPTSGTWRVILESPAKGWQMVGQWQPGREEALHLTVAP